MKNRFKTIICIILVLVLCITALCVPASSYINDVETSTEDMILINMDTNTVVFSKKPDNKWYSGYLTVLTTYLVVMDDIEDLDAVDFDVEESFIKKLPYTDGCLDEYVGDTLTAKDLMAIMLLTSGSDAAYALVSLSSYESVDDFVSAMNEKVVELGCVDTKFVTPGYSDDKTQHTTCRDLYYIYTAVRDTELFSEIMDKDGFIPSPYVQFTVRSDASILNPESPYYFRYVNDAKYSYSDKTYEGIVLTTTYRDKTYFFAGMLGYDMREENVYADAKKLTTWAYLNLSDRKVISAENGIAKVNVDAGWGGYEMELHPFSSAYKTLPNDFDERLLSYDVKLPESVSWPVFKGQGVGKAQIVYDTEKIEDVKLVSETSEGLDLLSDSARFGRFVWSQLLVNEPVTKPGSEPADKKED